MDDVDPGFVDDELQLAGAVVVEGGEQIDADTQGRRR